MLEIKIQIHEQSSDGHMRTSFWSRAMSAGEGIVRISELVGMKGGFMTVAVSIMVFRVS